MAKIGVDIGHGRNTFPPSKGVYHGGKGFHEHDANSRVAERLTAKLKAAGHTVFQAQKAGATDVSLTTRTSQYRAQGVDLIVSCHANAGEASANGYASFYWHSDSKAKKLSDLYADEIAKQGFKLWGGSRPSLSSGWSNFHMCRVPFQYGIPSILLENGFMTNSGDFEWIFGSKRDEYAEKCATAAFNAIQRYLGGKTATAQPTKTASTTTKAPTKAAASSSNKYPAAKSGEGIVDYLKRAGVDSSMANRKKLAASNGISGYSGTAAQNSQLIAKLSGSAKATASAPAKAASTAKASGSAIVPYPGKLIRKGSKGKDVGRIQRAVGVKADEVFGPATEAAVKAYQKRKGLSADGIVGPATWNVMF
ncbi:N-acetylmuramoyl-L-alanine amidase [Terribacillus saccharophilus]|uniref:N-acetylmuramoyl-L-alanine amidase n=1 Tax=Terribacillus saccharophilus TaxID=361277 RepID=UPI003D27DE59